MADERVTLLLEIGGRRWKQGRLDRIYFNRPAQRGGLEVDYYKTGNVKSAKLNGEHLSNTKARGLLAGKLWWDVAENQWDWKDLPDDMAGAAIESIEGELPADYAEPEAQ